MKRLSSYFEGVISKRLSSVETDPQISNQHEFNGVAALKSLLGLEKRVFDAEFMYLSSDDEVVSNHGDVTWYDSREKHATRSEHRLYYPTNDVVKQASEGDLLLIAKKNNDTILVLIAEAGSTFERQVLWLFNIIPGERKFVLAETEFDRESQLEFLQNSILETLGIELGKNRGDWLDILLDEFGAKFPSTRLFSEFARLTCDETDPLDSPDHAILSWINHEEMLFRTLEEYFVRQKLDLGFKDVEEFISYSLSIQNRRKSRMGFAFENHLKYLFERWKLRFSTQKMTEQNSKPDFLFPGIDEYMDSSFPTERLTMLGAKSSCKERWNQVLSEANRIEVKHLVTLEASISEKQTIKMYEKRLQLVLPLGLHSTYLPSQQNWLMSLSDFIILVKGRQGL